jgi:sterol desaturase/sphingolipid hydroxylase (fatty acid hydroxylase superfamily)
MDSAEDVTMALLLGDDVSPVATPGTRRRLRLGSPSTRLMLLLNGVGITLAATGAAMHGRVSPVRAALAVLFGAHLWTLVEYVVHRALLHGLLARYHARHHDQPTAERYLHGPLSAWAITYAVSLAGLTAGFGITAGLWAFVGLNVAYVVFELTHAAVHADFGARWFSAARRFHAGHHYGKTPRAYGFSTPYWDWIFGTLGPRRHFPRKALWLLPLPLPLVHFVLASAVSSPADEAASTAPAPP